MKTLFAQTATFALSAVGALADRIDEGCVLGAQALRALFGCSRDLLGGCTTGLGIGGDHRSCLLVDEA